MNFLARTWFHQTPRWVLENLSSAEIAELQAEYQLSPWGEQRSDVQGAMVAAAALHAAGAKQVELKDYIYQWDKPEPSEADVMQKLRRIIGESRFEDRRR